MVTSNKPADKKVVKMEDQANNAVTPPRRTLLEEVNTYLTCFLCRGYYIDATTIVECLHSFCRSCIIKHLKVNSYCPVCEMMINSAKPNIKPDKALQDIVYKLVPGLFQREMERRQQFYASRPGPAASATPEQRGEDTERIIFSPEDVISFSLEYADTTDNESISSRSSESSNETPVSGPTTRRYLQCPAVVNISHLKKFLSMKYDIDCTQFSIDILYKRVPLPDYYTLMDIAYIYNWKRNEPMRFFYHITDYTAIRSRYGLFDTNRKGSHFRDRKPSPANTEDTNNSSPAPPLNDPDSDGANSPMPDDKNKNSKGQDNTKKQQGKAASSSQPSNNPSSPSKKSDEDDVEKSQFLNSFELTAKNSVGSKSSSPSKSTDSSDQTSLQVKASGNIPVMKKEESPTKRKPIVHSESPNAKKVKIEPETSFSKPSLKLASNQEMPGPTFKITPQTTQNTPGKTEENKPAVTSIVTAATIPSKPVMKDSVMPSPSVPIQTPKVPKLVPPDQQLMKRAISTPSSVPSPKRKLDETKSTQGPPQKVVTPLKLQISKPESSQVPPKHIEGQKHGTLKKLPDLKPGVPGTSQGPNKGPIINRIRTDLLANNSDPMDRRKILPQVKSPIGSQSPGQTSGDPLKSIFDSCKINIPSSLSITLTDQKAEQRNEANVQPDQRKPFNKNNSLNGSNNLNAHKTPSPPVHNYIEILKLPDVDSKKARPETSNNQSKPNQVNKTTETPNQPSTAKGPVPNLKPIADTKLGKQVAGFNKPSANSTAQQPTFQQKFLQSLQQQSADISKLPKNKLQVPKLMPAVPKLLVGDSKDVSSSGTNANQIKGKPTGQSHEKNVMGKDNALDLSSATQTQLGPQQTKALETMQSIANLAKKQQALPSKASSLGISQNTSYPLNNKSMTSVSSPMRTPTSGGQTKNHSASVPSATSYRHELPHLNKPSPLRQSSNATSGSASPISQSSANQSPITAHPSPRSTRSPSSSPKLVIAEDKQPSSEVHANQSSQISSSQISSSNTSKSEFSGSKSMSGLKSFKPAKPTSNVGKMSNIRLPTASNSKPGSSAPNADILQSYQPQFLAQQAYIRQQLEMQSQIGHLIPTTAAQWLKMTHAKQFQDFMKSMHQSQSDFNNKESK